MSVEIELKLAIAPGDVARFRKHPLLAAVKSSRSRLYGIYFDTPEYDLFRNRGAFRLRREGYHWVQTVKLDSGSVGGLSARPEYEARVAGNQPDFAVLPEAARAFLPGDTESGLAPVFITDFRRTVWLLDLPGALVEVALDVGHIKVGEAETPVSEVELELKAGDGKVLFEVAGQLLESAPLVPEYRSKALRGYALAGVWRQAPAKAVAVAIEPGMAAAEAWRRSLLAGLDQLGRNLPGLLAEDDPEYLHQARVAVRRLRTMLSLGKTLGLEQPAWVDDLRWFMGELSPARDWDVFVTETLATVRAALPEPERLDELAGRADKARARAVARARAAAGSARLAALILDMGATLLEERRGRPRLAGWAGQCLDKRRHAFARLAKQLANLDAAGRHRARIAAKRLRYAGDAFSGLYGARARRYLDKLGALQDGLGAANDSVVAQGLLAELNRDGRLAHAAGLVEGFLAGHCLGGGDLASQSAKLAKAKPFWH